MPRMRSRAFQSQILQIRQPSVAELTCAPRLHSLLRADLVRHASACPGERRSPVRQSQAIQSDPRGRLTSAFLALTLLVSYRPMLKPLMQFLPEVDDRIQSANRIALFLDFDGTLAPIVPDPSTAELSPVVREALQRVVERESIVTTIISGRAVEDLYVRIRVDNVIYSGNHGLEIFGRGLRFVEPEADARREHLRRLTELLMGRLRHIPGVLVEDKGLTTSIHFRQAAEADVPAIEEAVRASVASAGAWFRLGTGREVFEIVPRTGWHKGAAVKWILRNLKEGDSLPIYIGDDNSDEDAFAVLPEGVTIRVGGQPATCAQYGVPGPAEVYRFLVWLENKTALTLPV
jgi:trehalose 6-phosphate phosphatase